MFVIPTLWTLFRGMCVFCMCIPKYGQLNELSIQYTHLKIICILQYWDSKIYFIHCDVKAFWILSNFVHFIVLGWAKNVSYCPEIQFFIISPILAVALYARI